MLKFLRRLLFTTIGAIVTALFIVLFFFLGILTVASLSSDSEVTVEDNSILVVDLNSVIKERVNEDPFTQLIGESPFGEAQLGLNQILKSLKKAATDDRIKGIVIESGTPQAGIATIDEIRNALKTVKDSGKFIYAFAPIYTQTGYYLSSVADKVYMPPQGMLEYKGLSSQRTFFKGSLEKLGVEMQIFKHGKFKSAVEPFMLDHMSKESKKQTSVYIGSIWDYMKEQISESRGISIETLNRLADNSSMFNDNQILLDNKLVDGLWYKDQLLDELKKITDTELNDDLASVSLSDYKSAKVKKKSKGFTKDKIAVIYAEGGIDDGSDDGINSEKLSKTIRKARRDSSIKAVVFRINSPGGSGMGSDVIWREVKLCQQEKPVIVSMGDYAASGGYYIACCADTIVASPVTLTGSIGVFGMIPNAEKLLTNKLGMTFDGVKTNTYADFPMINRAMRKDEKAMMQTSVEKFYKVFIGRCAEGRSTSSEAIDEIGQGRVWSGENATHINLVDVLGGIDTAIEIAKEKAGLEKYRIKELPEQKSPFEEIFSGMGAQAKAFAAQTFLGVNYEEIKLMNQIKEIQPIQARLPYSIEIR
ncbi:signal peptide peptidase SppA [Saccharicrinis aurantiacus]|uniref:signal peptide peptidase SppA n=1 Tax=Saccharicrinis aurantiacus TaxID=1849719 RepID=UPI000838E746|nr:signal peptide peptidase SppA [Saccharicrinis aurantiacus]